MPIPQRPLPSRRPGHAVPHKPKSTLTPTSANTLDWRAEVAFLDSYAQSRQARSVPSAGVAIMDAAARARERMAVETAASMGSGSGRREVGLEELIQDGKGKREKRATTAATLGFDFIHSPSVLVLPDTDTTSPPKLSTAQYPSGPAAGRPRLPLSTSSKAPRPPSPLAATPQTPGLVSSSALRIPRPNSGAGRAQTRPDDADDDSDLDEWEHIHIASDGGDDEELVLGELDLEDRDEMGGVSLVDRKEAVGMRRVDGVSYAAALGAR